MKKNNFKNNPFAKKWKAKLKKGELDDEGQVSRNIKSLRSFSEYCLSHPQERFWQALRNWFGVGFIGYSNDGKNWRDTFFLEEDKDYEINRNKNKN